MSKKEPPRIQRVNNIALTVGMILSVLTIGNAIALFYMDHISDSAHHHHYVCIDAANTLMSASDYLTSEARMYVMTGDREYADNYIREAYKTKRRDKALAALSGDSKHSESLEALTTAFEESSILSETELYAMNLKATATGLKNVPEPIANTKIDAEDSTLSDKQKEELAQELVLGNDYQQSKEAIIKSVSNCTNALIEELKTEEEVIENQRRALLISLSVLVVAFVLVLVRLTYANFELIVRPMREHVRSINEGASLDHLGAQEVQRMVDSYNAMYDENHRRTLLLEHEARTDALTGLLNRGSYDNALAEHTTDIALILMDVDTFKEINDEHGHATGDEVLKRVAKCIFEQFRASDFVCRTGGDEFAVIMTTMRNVERSVVQNKLTAIAESLRDEVDGVPGTTLSIGVAFSNDLAKDVNIYHAADQALYKAKEEGRDRVCFY